MNSEKRNALQLLMGCANRSTENFSRFSRKVVGNRWIDLALIALISLLSVTPASAAESLTNIIYTEAKVLLQPILDALIIAVVPIATAIGIGSQAGEVVWGDKDTATAKTEIKKYIKWAVYAEIALVAFWVIVKIVAAVGGKSVG